MTPQLTAAQKATLRAAILADATAGPLAAANDDQGVANWLNGPQAAFFVWKTRVTQTEMHAAYVWTEMDNLAQAKFNQLTLMLQPGAINPSIANVRQGISDIFSAAQLVNTKAALTALAKRATTTAEKLLATGTGTNAVPATLGAEGNVSALEAGDILRN